MMTILKSWMNWITLLSVLYALAFFFQLTPADSTGEPSWQSFALLVLAIVGFMATFFPVRCEIGEHGKDLGYLRTVDAKITSREEHVSAVKANFKELESVLANTLDKLPEQLMNQDNPVAAIASSLMDEVSEAESKLVSIKLRKQDYVASVEARKIGAYSWIVDYFGEQ